LTWPLVLVAASGWAAQDAPRPAQANSGSTEPVREDALDVAPPNQAAVLDEVRALRADVLRLQQAVDSLTGGELAQLRAENERLRRELRELSGMTGQSLPPVPMPDRALLEGLYPAKKTEEAQTTVPEPAPADADTKPEAPAKEDANDVEAAPAGTPAAPAPFTFEIIEEWGRSPEELTSSNRQGASLKGIIGVVPPNSSDDDLTQLGRSLHEQYAAFDNVNIEVFDDIEAARSYKGKYVAPPKHRVLSISKHKTTGRDVILLIRDEKAVAVPLAPEDSSTS